MLCSPSILRKWIKLTSMHEQMDQTRPSPDDLSTARIELRDDPLREVLAPLLEEFHETIQQSSKIIETFAHYLLPREHVPAVLELSVRQLTSLANILKALNDAGTAFEQRESRFVFALLPLIAGLLRGNKYRSDEENAFLLAFEQSRTEDDRQVRLWYPGIVQYFYAMPYTDRFPGAHEYLRKTDAEEQVQDLLQEIAEFERQFTETEDPAAKDALEAKIAAIRLRMSDMLESSHVRPEHVKSLIDAVEVHFSFRKLPLAAYAELVNDLHLLFDAVCHRGGDAQMDRESYLMLPLLTGQGMIQTIAARNEDVQSLLDSDRAGLFHAFLLARDAMLHGVRWFENFPHSVEDKHLETRLKKILRPLTPMTLGLVEQAGYDPNDLYNLATQPSYQHDGGHDFSCVAAFCDVATENPGVLHGAITAQLLTLQHFFAAAGDDARRISREVLRGIGTDENFRRDAPQLIEDIRMMLVERPGEIAAAFLDREIAGECKSKSHTLALVLSLAAICSDKALAVKVKNRIPHLRILLEKPEKLGRGALPAIIMPYVTRAVKTLGVSLDDYYGNAALVTEVRRVVDQFFEFQQHPELLEGRTPDQVIINGILTYGDYGVGKTFLMQCVMGEYGFRAFPISTEIFTKEKDAPILSHDELVAYSEQVFARATEASRFSPVLLTIDELFEFTADRIKYPAKETVTNYYLRKIQEIRKGYPAIFLMANSNCFDELDPGVKRPGRFDVRRPIGPMDKVSFEQLIDATLLLETHTCYGPDELSVMADSAIGLTPFATIQAIVNFCRLQHAHGEASIPDVAQIVRALGRMQELTIHRSGISG